MNEYAKEGTKFLKTLDDYFKEFEKVVGYSINDLLRTKTPIPENIPDPIKIIDSLEMFFHMGAKTSLFSSIEGMALTDSAHFLDLTGKFQMMAFESWPPIWEHGKSHC